MLRQIAVLTSLIIAVSITAKAQDVGTSWARGLIGSGEASISEIAVDASNNVYITGSFTGEVDFDPSSAQVLITSAGSGDIFIAKYTVNGDYVWAKTMGSTSNDVANSLKIDQTNSALYICGHYSGTVDFNPDAGTTSKTSAGASDAYVARFNSDGTLVWVQSIGSTTTDVAIKLDISSNSQVFVGGKYSGTVDFDPGAGAASKTSAGGTDIFIAIFTTAGVFQHVQSVGGTGEDLLTDMVIDCCGGQVFITGSFTGTADFNPAGATANITSAGGTDAFVAEYSVNGTPTIGYRWAYNIGSTGDDAGTAIDFKDTGTPHALYITGGYQGTVDLDPTASTFSVTSNGGTDIYVARLTDITAGFQWGGSFGGTSNDTPQDIYGQAGPVVVTANFIGSVDADLGAGTTTLQGDAVATSGFFANYSDLGVLKWARVTAHTRTVYYAAVDKIYLSTATNRDFDLGAGTLFVTGANTFEAALIRHTDVVVEPSQATAQEFTNIGTTSLTVNSTQGTGTGKLVLVKQNAAVDAYPSDAQNYTVNTVFGSGAQIGTGNYAVQSGTGLVNITGLTPNTTYHFRTFEYAGTGTSRNYNTSSVSGNPSSVTTLQAEPTNQAHTITFNSVDVNTMTVGWTNGNGAERVVVARAGSQVNVDPVDGTSYTGNSDFGSAVDIGSGNKIVYRGTGNSVSLTNLPEGAVYHFRVYEFNGLNTAINYITSTPSGNPSSKSTLSGEPAVNSSGINFSPESIGSNVVTMNFFPGSGTASRLVVARQGGPVTAEPVDGQSYAANNSFGVGSQIGSGNFVVGSGSSPITVTNLLPNTTYHFRIFDFFGALGTENYLTTTPAGNPASVTTLVAEPTAQASDILFSAKSTTTVNLNWTNGNGTERIVLAKASFAVDDQPADGTAYTGVADFSLALTIGTGSRVVYRGAGTSLSVSGLSPGVTYHFRIFELNGTVAQTNYLTTAVGNGNPANVAVLATEPTVQASQIEVSNPTTTSVQVSFTDGNGAGRLVIVKVAATDAVPTDGTVYTAGSFGTGSQLGAGNYVVRVGSGPFILTGLSQDTEYGIRVFEFNGSGGAENYFNLNVVRNPYTFRTLVAEPTTQGSGISFSLPTTNSMTVTWTAGNGERRLLLARPNAPVTFAPADGIDYGGTANYTAGADLGNGQKVVYSGTGNSITVTGLAEGTTYHFRLFEFNGSTAVQNYLTTGTENSGFRSTLVAEPVNQPTDLVFSNVTHQSLTANFTASSPAADGYIVLRRTGPLPNDILVDGTPYAANTTLGGSKIVFVGNGTTFNDSGLEGGTLHHYAVFSLNGNGSSVNYKQVSPARSSQLTIPSAPSPSFDQPSLQPTAFTAKWSAVTGASGYQLDVSKDEFVTMLPNYDSKTISASAEPNETVTGLTPSSSYKFRVRAVNASGVSPSSSAISLQTPAAAPGTTPLSLSDAAAPKYIKTGAAASVSVDVTGGTAPITVTVKYRGAASSNAEMSMAAVQSGATISYEAVIPFSALDEIGLEYYLTAQDASGTVSQVNHSFLYTSFDAAASPAIPLAPGLNGKAATYQMFSVPYVLDDKDVEVLFVNMGEYNKAKWRLFHYQGGANKEYKAGINTIELGLGYWFNAKSNPAEAILIGASKAAGVTRTAPFTITYEKGWNQVGDPYPFNLDWAAVKAANPSVGLNSLFEGTGSGYTKQTAMHPWKGAFVFADNGGTVTYPLAAKCASCRTQTEEFAASIDEPSWQLPITLHAGGRQQIGVIGMHPDAKLSKDRFDEIAPPRFIEYLELVTDHKEFFAPKFASDIVPSTGQYEWTLETNSNFADGKAVIEWDHKALAANESNLILVDMADNVMLNMKSSGRYEFSYSDARQFKIIYSRDEEFQPGAVMLGAAYPNPFTDKAEIPLLITDTRDRWTVHVYNLLGQHIKTIEREFNKKGLQNLVWDGKDENGIPVPSGVYIYKVSNYLAGWKRLIKQQ